MNEIKIDQLKIKLDEIINNPETLKEVEDFHRRVSNLSFKDLWKHFTI